MLRNRIILSLRKSPMAVLGVLLPCLLPCTAVGLDFRVADMEGLFNATLAYGLLARTQGRDKDLIAIANGGTAPSANTDDGDLNQDPGLVSNMVRTTGEVTLRWRNFGAYVRGFAFYDFQQELHDLERTPLGAFGANTVVRGFKRQDKTQLEVGVTQLLDPRLRASQTVLGFDIGWVHIHNLPASHPSDEDSWGYRLVGLLTYDSIFGGVTLQPRVVWAQDVNGITPGPGGAFIDGRRAFNVGLGGEYVNRWTADLSYTSFFGGGSFNQVRDRDFLSFPVAYHY